MEKKKFSVLKDLMSEIIRPALNLSKSSYLDLMIREFFKGKVKNDQREIHSIPNAHKNQKQVSGWISDVEEIHKRRVAPTVFYTKKMPEIDSLMQVWDPEFENVITRNKIGDSSIPLSTEQLVRIACNLADVPIHETNNDKNLIESLHVLFQLYSAFNSNDHFQNNTVSMSHQALSNVQRIEFN